MHPDPQPRAGATGARFKSSPDASRCAPDLVALHPRPHLSPPSSPPPPMIPIRSVSLRRSQRCAERHNLLRKWRILKQKWHKSLAGLRPAPRDKMTFRLGARPDLRNTPCACPLPPSSRSTRPPTAQDSGCLLPAVLLFETAHAHRVLDLERLLQQARRSAFADLCAPARGQTTTVPSRDKLVATPAKYAGVLMPCAEPVATRSWGEGRRRRRRRRRRRQRRGRQQR